jgi:hypothetical protein
MRSPLAVGLVMVALVAGCTGPGSSPSPSTAVDDAFRVDWTAAMRVPGGPDYVRELPNDWTVKGCPPFVCLNRDTTSVMFTVREFKTNAAFDAMARADGEAAALEDLYGRFLDELPRQRRSCFNYTLTPDPPARLTTRDGVVVRSGYTGRLAAGPTDMATVYLGVRDGRIIMVSGQAAGPGACVVGDGSTTPGELTSAVPTLDKVIVASGLPRPSVPPRPSPS